MATTVFEFMGAWDPSNDQITSIGTGLSPFTVTYSGSSIPVGGSFNYTDGNNTAFGGTYDGTNSLGDLLFHSGGKASFEVFTNFEYANGAPIEVDAQPFARTISASGTWGDGTPITSFSQPGASWSFSFDLPNPISSNPTDQATHFSYITDGTAFFFPSVVVQFFPADLAGMFDLTFPDGDVFSLYGADIGTSLTLVAGQYNVEAGMQMLPASGIGTATVSLLGPVVTGFGAGAVPEPSTWVMMLLGFAALGFAGYRTSRKRAMLAYTCPVLAPPVRPA
jgi:PEP-CTERM motif